ncbi:hypothetical protein APSETT445_008312 [Aspergillus pseudonomiae]
MYGMRDNPFTTPYDSLRNPERGKNRKDVYICTDHFCAAQANALRIDVRSAYEMLSKLQLEFVVRTTKARASTLHLPHGSVPLPIFMPVATQASLKGLTYDQLKQTGCMLCLNNTYHLGLKPGQAVLDEVGGAHKLQGWDRNILTDSGGLLTPEHSISLQNSIGSDIIMQLDDVIATTSPDHARIEEAMERSVRWLDRCIDAHKYPERQNLFCIIQGGLDLELRRKCCAEMVARDTPGIAIGGLSGGEAKEEFCKVGQGNGWRSPVRLPNPPLKDLVLTTSSLTIHNVHYLLSLMGAARQAILEDRFPAFLREFFSKLYGDKSKYPEWAVGALRGVGVDLMED